MKMPEIQKLIDTYRAVDNSAFEKRVSEEYVKIGDNPLYGFKYAGSNAEKAGGDYIYSELKKIGVDKVERIPVSSGMFQFNDATITVVEGSGSGAIYKPGPYISPGTSPDGITAELLDLGGGMLEDFESNDVRGKIVIIDGAHDVGGSDHIPPIMNADERGAAAVIIYQRQGAYDENTVRTQPTNEIPGIPVVGMCLKDVAELQAMLKNGKVVLNLRIDSTLKEKDAESYTIIGEITGSIPDERVIISGHLDHYFRCMQDDISAVVTNLSIAKAMVDSGYRPRRTINFMFVSSHETGSFFSLTPYIHGSYQVMADAKSDWEGKVVAAINFEYTALRLKKLRAFGSYELRGAYSGFLEYMPDDVPCYNEIDPELGTKDEYYLMAWADSVSYINRGIPVLMNDSITEQFTEEGSLYSGRDHSTSDNQEVYDYEVLSANVKWYGSLAIYLAETAVPEYDFTQRTEIVKLSDDEKRVLERFDIRYDEYENVVNGIDALSADISQSVATYNESGGEDNAGSISGSLMNIMLRYSRITDWINGYMFLQVPHKKYCGSIGMLLKAISEIRNGEVEKALYETLAMTDMGHVTAYHGEYPSRRMEEINKVEETKDWRRDRETSVLFLIDPIMRLKEHIRNGDTDYSDVVAMLEKTIESEQKELRQMVEMETRLLGEVAESMKSCLGAF